jgi:hypothetical protein
VVQYSQIIRGNFLSSLSLNFWGINVSVISEWSELVDVLTKDFWSYIIHDKNLSTVFDLSLKIVKTDEAIPIPEGLVASMQTQNAITYDFGDVRFCNYYSKAFSEINFKTNQAIIQGVDFDKIHEIAYLLILSRIGKKLDLNGFHKLHAFAVSFKDLAFVCMMPSKGGKSTLLVELLKDPRIKMISDDIPMIDSFGRVHPFALKIGLDQIPPELEVVDKEINVYSIKREAYGEKKLVCTRGIQSRIEQGAVFKKIILAEGVRFNSDHSVLAPASWRFIFKGLFKHGIIGVGSPIVVEYFWESGIRDFFTKTKVFFKRLFGFLSLSFRAKKMKLLSGRDPSHTSKVIIDFLEKNPE